jgi:hypothetical protein
MHVTYEFKKRLTYFEFDEEESSSSSDSILSQIDQYISQLEQEQNIIRHICSKLTLFLTENSISPTNDDVIEYINLILYEEKQKRNAGFGNKQIIHGLENMIREYQDELKFFKSNIDDEIDKSDVPTIDDIFVFQWQLFELPITGKYMKQQIESLNFNQMNMIEQREDYVELPRDAKFSANMQQLKRVMA